MCHASRLRLAAALCLGVGITLLAGVAWAYWTGSGSGAAPAVSSTLLAPGTPTMSEINGSVTVTWTASVAPGAGTLSYSVQRRDAFGAAWVDTCGTTSVTHITTLACSDAPGAGAYVWRVTAYFSTWTALSDESNGFAVGSADQTPPTGVVTAPSANSIVRGSIPVTSDSADAGSGVASARFQLSPHSANTWTTIAAADTTPPYGVTWDTSTTSDGLYDLRVVTTDNVGNSFASPLVMNVRVDNTAPALGVALGSSPTGASQTGMGVYFKADASGSFRFVATVNDGGSGPALTTFPLLSAANWTTHTAETVSTPAGGPYTSTAFAWAPRASVPSAITISAQDVAGNTATASITFAIDTTAPTGEITAPASAGTVRGTATVASNSADTGSGVASAQFQTSPAGANTWSNLGAPATTSPYSASWDTTGFADGLYDLRVITTDNVGNPFTSTTVTNVRVDNTAPTLSLSLAVNPTGAYLSVGRLYFKANAAGSYALVATVTDGGSGAAAATFPLQSALGWTTHTTETVITPAGGPFTSTGFAWASGASAPGIYTVTATDTAGNTATSAITPTIDSTGPTGSVTAPVAAANIRGNLVSVTSNSVDAGSGVKNAQFQTSPAGASIWSNLGAPATTSPYAASWDTTGFADGLYDLRVITTDNVGNTFTSTTIANVRVDNTTPTGLVTAPSSSALIKGTYVVTSNSADTGSGVNNALFQRSPAGTNTWTSIATADTTAPYTASWTTTTPGDGLYDLRVITTDKSGNTFTSALTTNVRVDNTAPIGSVTVPAASANVRGTIAVTSNSSDAGSGVATVQFQTQPSGASLWNNLGGVVSTSPYSTSWDTTTFTDGLYSVRVVATDVAGNVATSASITNVRVDNTAPAGAITAPAAATNVKGTVTVTSNSADTGSGVLNALFQTSLAGTSTWTNIAAADTTSPYAVSWVTTGYAAGLYDIRVITTDRSGNPFTSTLTTNVRVDNTAPAVAVVITSPVGAYQAGQKIYFRASTAGSFGFVATVTDAGSGPASALFPTLSATNWTTHNTETVTTPSGGPFPSTTFSWISGAAAPVTFTITGADRSGNTGTSAFTFTADSTAPAGSITAPLSAGNVRGTSVNVTSNSTDAGSGVNNAQFQISPAGLATWNNLGAPDTTSPYSATWDTTAFTEGLYDLRVITTDNVGNAFTSTTATNVRVDNTPPTGSISAPLANAFVNGAFVAVSANSADAGSGVLNAQFQTSTAGTSTWVNLGAADTTSPYGVTWNTTSGYPDGRYDLRVITTDKSGNTTTGTTITVEVQNAAPTPIAMQLANGTGTNGTVDQGDTITVTYSQTIRVSTLCSTWSGDLTNQALNTVNDITVTLTDGGAGNDTITVTSATSTLHFGTINLGATGYVTGGDKTFSGNTDATKSTVAWNATTHALVITLGKAAGTGTIGTVAASNATYTPDAAIKNGFGTAITGNLLTGTLTQF